jgi:hypothetical protein
MLAAVEETRRATNRVRRASVSPSSVGSANDDSATPEPCSRADQRRAWEFEPGTGLNFKRYRYALLAYNPEYFGATDPCAPEVGNDLDRLDAENYARNQALSQPEREDAGQPSEPECLEKCTVPTTLIVRPIPIIPRIHLDVRKVSGYSAIFVPQNGV